MDKGIQMTAKKNNLRLIIIGGGYEDALKAVIELVESRVPSP
jgi:hypothetical protein